MNGKIRDTKDILKEIDLLEDTNENKKRERTALTKEINARAKRIDTLKEMAENNNQFNMFEGEEVQND